VGLKNSVRWLHVALGPVDKLYGYAAFFSHNIKLRGLLEYVYVGRAGLKPMQPMRLHWAPRHWGPRAMCLDSSSVLPNTPCTQIQKKRFIKWKSHCWQTTLSLERPLTQKVKG